jgi:hypothetical protein
MLVVGGSVFENEGMPFTTEAINVRMSIYFIACTQNNLTEVTM